MTLSLPHAMGEIVWQRSFAHHPILAALHAGIVPILTRLVVEGGEGPISLRAPLEGRSIARLAHTVGESGEVERLLLQMWVRLEGRLGRARGEKPAEANQPLYAGRIYAEHVFTRLFAPLAERKITRFDLPGLPSVPPARSLWRSPNAVLAPPPSAVWLDDAMVLDEAPVAFALHHTDSNQHVNSLVYPRLFQDAVARRLAAHGIPTKLFSRRFEVAYRKPCFAGDRLRLTLRAFADGDRLGAVGALLAEGAPIDKAHCTLQAIFAL